MSERMVHDHALMYVLCAIIVLNIIAIVLLQNRIAEKDLAAAQGAGQQAGQPGTAAGNGAQGAAQGAAPIRPDRPDVRTLVLEAPCADCFDVRAYLAALNDTIDMQVESVPTDKAAAFSARLPAVAFNASIESYPSLVTNWEPLGSIITIKDGEYAGTWYVLPSQNPPYSENGTVQGRVSVTYLTMDSCAECYGTDVLRDALAGVRITPYREQVIDISSAEGKRLVAKYNITAVPTLLMDRQADLYRLQPGWDVVGTVEPDGTYILRDLQRLQVIYYDLPHKRLMKP